MDIENNNNVMALLNGCVKTLIEDFRTSLSESMEFTRHPTPEDALSELGRAELLFIMLINALSKLDIQMSSILFKKVEDWQLFPRVTTYLGSKLQSEWFLPKDVLDRASKFASYMNKCGLMKVPNEFQEYLNLLISKEEKTGQVSANGQNMTVRSFPVSQEEGKAQVSEIKHIAVRKVSKSKTREKKQAPIRKNVRIFEAVEKKQGAIVQRMQPQKAEEKKQGAIIHCMQPQKVEKKKQGAIIHRMQPQKAEEKKQVTFMHPPETKGSGDTTALLIGKHQPLAFQSDEKQSQIIKNSQPQEDSHPAQRNELNIFDAVETNQCADIKEAISRGININEKNKKGYSLLHIATKYSFQESVKQLIELGAGINTRDKFLQTPLHYAAKEGSKECLELLIDADAILDPQDHYRRTPLHYAAGEGFEFCTLRLLQAGADPDALSIQRNTPLHCAAIEKHLRCYEILVNYGADETIKNKFGKTPLDCR